jgi:hypothetical protein
MSTGLPTKTMPNSSPGLNGSDKRERWVLLLSIAVLVSGVFMQFMGQLNHDVAFLSWAAKGVIGGAVLGRDLVEVNFPLAVLIYAPAALLSELLPFPLAIRLWVLLIGLMAIGVAWGDIPPRSRSVVLLAFAAYAGFAWPREFGQREHIAFMLVLPYAIPAERHGARAIVVGVMGALGFALKPPLLLAWILVEMGRPLLRREQAALVVTGALYGLAMLTVFREFTFGMLGTALDSYGVSDSAAYGVARVPALLVVLALGSAWWCRDSLARSLALAALGFLLAAIIQMKFYNYHFVATCGYSVLSLVASARSGDGLRRLVSGLALVLAVHYLHFPVKMWWSDAEGRMASAPHLLRALDGARSFLAVGVHPYPGFPTALYAEDLGIRYLGVACCASYLPAAVAGDARAVHLARQQLLTELRRHPDVVLVDTDWRRQTNIPRGFDGLAWYLEDPALAQEWGSYELFAQGGPFRFYRRAVTFREVK